MPDPRTQHMTGLCIAVVIFVVSSSLQMCQLCLLLFPWENGGLSREHIVRRKVPMTCSQQLHILLQFEVFTPLPGKYPPLKGTPEENTPRE